MKTINQITIKNLKLNKSRTIVTIIGILLSCALITVVANMAFSFQKTMLMESELTTGNYIYRSEGHVDTDEIENLKANRNVESVYVNKYLGFANIEKPKRKEYSHVLVAALNQDAFQKGFHMELSAGRFPQNSNEIILCNNMIKYSEKNYRLGDEITFDLGDRYQIKDGTATPMDLGDNMVEGKCELRNMTKKTYKIVGFLAENHSPEIETRQYYRYGNAYTLYEGELITERESRHSVVYANYKESELKNYKEITAQLLGVSSELVDKYLISGQASDTEREAFESQMKTNQYVSLNTGLITRRGIDLSDIYTKFLTGMVLIVIFIIMFVSVFVIRNSFAISISEKTKLYGMMASVGATTRQIRNNVLFEGLILGVIGVPLGIGLGFAVSGGLVAILNLVAGEFLNGFSIVFGTSGWAVVIAVLVSGITIYLSCIAAAIRASKISPIMAIRNTEDVKIGKKKNFKTPKYISKLFGIGGEIAHKNLKRNKKKYRTTVISIVVSVVLFISMAAFMEYTFNLVIEEVGSESYDYTIQAMTTESDVKISDCMEKFHSIRALGMDNGGYVECRVDCQCPIEKKWIRQGMDEEIFEVSVLDHTSFQMLVKDAGLSYEKTKGKAIYYSEKMEDGTNRIVVPENEIVAAYDTLDYEEDGALIKKGKKAFELTVAGEVKKVPEWMDSYRGCSLFVEEGTLKDRASWGASMCLKAENADELEAKILSIYEDRIDIVNFDKEIRALKAVRLIVGIFVYGFIIVISLIGITNIFNTITTTMKLRQKEFAMLRSVGMTNKEFNKMIRLESILYGVKALMIGLPLGLAGNYLIYDLFRTFNEEINPHYVFPYLEVVGSILAVLLLIRVIMSFSVSKTKNQNIIETIRNDNI
ncbi:MAG: ABC transporter permease [Eubacterium sp.]|nr:ABC transporter permease [Eubacterium sp.]